MIQIRQLMSQNEQLNRAAIVSFFLALTVGLFILIFPPAVPLILVLLLVVAFLIIEQPESVIIMIAVTGLLIHVMIGGGRYYGTDLVYDRNNLLIVDLFSVISVVAIVIGRVTGKVDPLIKHNFYLPLLLLALYSVLSLLWAQRLSASLVILVQFLSCIVLLNAPIALLRHKRTLTIFLSIWVFVGIIASILAISTLYVKYGHLTLYYTKYQFERFLVDFKVCIFDNIKQRVGGFGDPNRVAHLLNTTFLAGLVLFLYTKSRIARILISMSMLLFLYTIVHTLSKGGLGSFLVAITLFIVSHQRFKGKEWRALALLGIAMVCAIIAMSIIDLHGGLGRFGQSPVESRGSSSLALRFKWWRHDWAALDDSGGLGVGVGGMANYIWAYAQSSYFSLMADLGLFGFLLAAWFVFTFVVELYRKMSLIRGDNIYYSVSLMGACSMLIFSIHSIVDFGYNLRIPWILGGLAMASAELGIRMQHVESGPGAEQRG